MSLLALPLEIRIQIYKLAFCSIDHRNPYGIDLPKLRRHEHPLLHVNGDIRAEALHVWLSRQEFYAPTFVPASYALAARSTHQNAADYVGNAYGRWLEDIGPDNAKWTGRIMIKIVQYLAGEIVVEIPARKGVDREAWPRGKIKIEAAFDRPYKIPSEAVVEDGRGDILTTTVELLNRSRKTGRITMMSENVPRFVDSIYQVVNAAGKAEWEEYHPTNS